jgi:iron-sulfur cluster repair protein YtfE (RIC family)
MAKTAIQILKEDHAKAKRLFEEIENAETDEECEEKWETLANDLRAHVQLEKEVFYPAIIAKIGDDIPNDIIDDQETEETEATEMLEELDGDELDDDAWMEKFREFKDVTLEHAVEVEEGELFPLLERKMSKRDLEELGTRMEKRHKELHQQIEAQAP